MLFSSLSCASLALSVSLCTVYRILCVSCESQWRTIYTSTNGTSRYKSQHFRFSIHTVRGPVNFRDFVGASVLSKLRKFFSFCYMHLNCENRLQVFHNITAAMAHFTSQLRVRLAPFLIDLSLLQVSPCYQTQIFSIGLLVMP